LKKLVNKPEAVRGRRRFALAAIDMLYTVYN